MFTDLHDSKVKFKLGRKILFGDNEPSSILSVNPMLEALDSIHGTVVPVF